AVATAALAAGGAFASAGAPSALACAPTPAGCEVALATADWPRVVSQGAKELAALPAIDCPMAGVRAAPRSFAPPAEAMPSPVTRLSGLAVGSVTSQM